MGVPEITLTEDKRCLLSKVSSGICLATIPFNFIMLAMGIYIELAVQDKIGLIEGSRDALPAFMIVLSFFGLIGNVLGARVCWVIQDIKRRKAWKKYLKIYVIISLVMFVCVFVSSMLCFASIASLRKLFGRGILSSMKKYSTDMPKKHIIDLLQIQYKCCGSTGYTDWFNYKFVSKKYLSDDYMTTEEQETYNKHEDNVPFSCCNPNVLRPCINTRVHGTHFRYNYGKDLTVYRRGCGDALMKSYKTILNASGAIIVILALVQLALATGTRLLQTGIENLKEDEDSTAYLFPTGAKGGEPGGKGKDDETQNLLAGGDLPDDDIETQKTLEEDLPPPPMSMLASLQNLPPVGSIDELSVDESFDEVEEDENFIPPRQSVRYVNEM